MQVSENGGYGAHFDDRDVAKTEWTSYGHCGLVFPTHEHTVYLQPGDVIRFHGAFWFHANMLRPDEPTVVQALQREYLEVRAVEKALGQGSPETWGGAVGPSNLRNLRGKFQSQAVGLLQQQQRERYIDQFISCLYFQKQQQSYVVNHHNARTTNPDERVVIDENGQWDEHGCANATTADSDGSGSDDDHLDGQLSDFELRRLDNMRCNAAELQRLNLA